MREVIRIPSRRDGQRNAKPRNILVKLEDGKMQKKLLGAAKKLKNKENWSSIYLSPDLTKMQREKAYQLRVERRRRTEEGEVNLVIRNGAVVDKNTVQPFRGSRDGSARTARGGGAQGGH